MSPPLVSRHAPTQAAGPIGVRIAMGRVAPSMVATRDTGHRHPGHRHPTHRHPTHRHPNTSAPQHIGSARLGIQSDVPRETSAHKVADTTRVAPEKVRRRGAACRGFLPRSPGSVTHRLAPLTRPSILPSPSHGLDTILLLTGTDLHVVNVRMFRMEPSRLTRRPDVPQATDPHARHIVLERRQSNHRPSDTLRLVMFHVEHDTARRHNRAGLGRATKAPISSTPSPDNENERATSTTCARDRTVPRGT